MRWMFKIWPFQIKWVLSKVRQAVDQFSSAFLLIVKPNPFHSKFLHSFLHSFTLTFCWYHLFTVFVPYSMCFVHLLFYFVMPGWTTPSIKADSEIILTVSNTPSNVHIILKYVNIYINIYFKKPLLFFSVLAFVMSLPLGHRTLRQSLSFSWLLYHP